MGILNEKDIHRADVVDYLFWKNIFDRSAAFVMLLFAAPVIIFLVALVKLTSKGPGFYSQVRVGKDGKPFRIYKIRSMRCDAETETGAVWAARRDPRITRLGQFLRKSHLDELPQLYNVLRGDMSLVGPRPERPEFVQILDKEIDGYSDRLLVKPGVTGYAQVNLPSDIDLNDVRRKLVLDFEYIEKASLSFDIRLIIGTTFRFVTVFGTIPLVLLGIHRKAEESKWTSILKINFDTVSRNDELTLETLFKAETAAV